MSHHNNNNGYNKHHTDNHSYNNDTKRAKYDSATQAITNLERKQSRWQRSNNNDSKQYDWGNTTDNNINNAPTQPIVKQQPNYNLTGLLKLDQQNKNTVSNVKQSDIYNEPSDKCKPDKQYRLYVYKDKQLIDTIHLQQSMHMIGRDSELCSIHTQHESCSKQHAVIQFRLQSKRNIVGETINTCKPYIIDLDSRNHTYLNKQPIEPQRYYELLDNDVLVFGDSTRKYVFINADINKK